MYHLALGTGTVKEISDKFIIVEFASQKLKYSKQDIGLLIFDSKKEMCAHFSKTFKIPYYTVEAISNRVLMPHKLSLEYYNIFERIFENKYKRYYRFVCESLEWLKDQHYISIRSSYDSGKIDKIIKNFLNEESFIYAARLSIYTYKDSLLKKCCNTYMSININDLDKILRFFSRCIKRILALYPLNKKQNNTTFDDRRYKENLYVVILSLVLKFDEEDFLLMKLEEPLFDEGDYSEFLDNLIKYADNHQKEKQYLDKFIDIETKTLRETHKPKATIASSTTMHLKELKEQLPKILRERDITDLLHFTHINNIPSIIASGGLWPRSMHEELGIIAEYSDEMRLDNRLNATSLSVSFPNYKMLYQKYKLYGANYAILILDPKLLYQENEKAFFYYTNAASYTEKNLRGCDIKSFNKLFDERIRRKTIPQKYTTNPQAEILIEGIVNIKYIKEIHVHSIAAKEKLYCIIDDVALRKKIQVNPFYFRYENGKKIWESEVMSNGQANIF